MRTIVNLPEDQIKALDRYGEIHQVSRTEVVRQAVAAFLPKTRSHDRFQKHPAFGSWRRKSNSSSYVRKLRSEWTK